MDVARIALLVLGLLFGINVFAQSSPASPSNATPIPSSSMHTNGVQSKSFPTFRSVVTSTLAATAGSSTSSKAPDVTYGAPYYFGSWSPSTSGGGCINGEKYATVPDGPPEETIDAAITDYEDSIISCFGNGCSWKVTKSDPSNPDNLGIAANVSEGTGFCEGNDENIYATAHASNVGSGDVGGDGEGDEQTSVASPNVGDPINSSTGNKYLKQSDYVDAPSWLTFRRFYNSNPWVPGGSLGQGWRNSFDRSIAVIGSPPSYIIMTRPDGSQETFTKNNGVWSSKSSSVDTLTETDSARGVPTGYSVFLGANRHTETYNAAGLLTAVTDQTGQGITLTYSTASTSTTIAPKAGLLLLVKDLKGRTLSFTYNESAQVSNVTLPDGGTLAYTYDSGWLSSVTYPDTSTRQYRYNESKFVQASFAVAPYMTGLIDESGTRYSTTAYDSNNRATVTLLGGGSFSTGGINRTQVTYNGDGTSTVTYPLGNTVTLGFAHTSTGINQVSSLNQACSTDCKRPWKSQTFDANGYPKASIDFKGNKTVTQYDAFGELTVEVDASGTTSQRTIQTTWDTKLRLPLTRTVLDASGNTLSKTAWVYNPMGKVLAMCAIDATKVSAYTCATTGTPPSGVRRWTYTYCTSIGPNCPLLGLLLTATSPRTDLSQTTEYTYYTTSSAVNCGTPGAACFKAGDLHTIKDAKGHVTTIASYDANGRVTRTIDANGVDTDSTYTARGWLASRTTGGATTAFTYWPFGAVETITDPDGIVTTFNYDNAHRLVEIQDGLGNYIDYNLDEAGNKTGEQTYIGSSNTLVRNLSRTFNTLGQLTAIVDGRGKTVFDASASNSYDANGNLVVSADALGIQTQHAYDPLNRLVGTIQNYNGKDVATQNAATVFDYDALDHLTGVSDPNELNTIYGYDGLSNRVSLQSPDTGHSSNTYDASGNLLTHTDAKGVVATSAYDALNRVISTTYTDSTQNVFYGYDEADSVTGCAKSYPVGRLTRMVEKAVTTIYCYDTRGNVVRKRQLLGTQIDTTVYAYTSANRLKSTHNPDGTVVGYTYDATGRIKGIAAKPAGSSNPVAIVSHVVWLPFGPVSSYKLANGQVITRTYDANYGLTDLTSAALKLHFARDAAGRVGALGDAPGASPAIEAYNYDPLYRLTTVVDSGKALEAYTYNKSGDRLSKAASGLATGAYGYKANTHWLTSIGTATRTYDGNGNTASSRAAGNTYVIGYNARNRLVSVVLNSSTVGTYIYNALGQRIQKATTSPANVNERFAYDENGVLIGEYGSDNRDYIWMEGIPVAVVDVTLKGSVASSVVNYIHADHLGTPRAVTDGAGRVIWSWAYKSNPFGEQQPSSTGYVFNLRYLGQYYDAEKGSNYNYSRDYDPAIGRYFQSDFIGLQGGVSTYAYVGGNPLNGTDPLGLFLWPWESPVTVHGGTQDQQNQVINAVNQVLSTPRGQEMLNQIEGPWYEHGNPQDIYINDNGQNGSPGLGSGQINIDPDSITYVPTTAGNIRANLTRIVGHELGHSLMCDDDDGPGRMNNVNKNENPIMGSLGQPLRTSYYPY